MQNMQDQVRRSEPQDMDFDEDLDGQPFDPDFDFDSEIALLRAQGDDQEADYLSHLQREQQVVTTRERRRCYQCRPVTGRVRRVTSGFVTSKNFDPTTAYRLVCGHITIDC